MVIGIGHRRQNITPTEAIKGGIKSLYIIDEPGTAASAMKSKEFDETKGSLTQAWFFFAYGTATMAIGIGNYGQNITPTEAMNGSIKSPDIIDERGTSFLRYKSKGTSKKNHSKIRIMAYYKHDNR